MKFSASTAIDRQDDENVKRFTSLALDQIQQILNNGIMFSDNFDAKQLNVTFSAANTDTAAIHGLGRVPGGYVLVGANAAMSVYDGASASTSQVLYLKSSATGTARLLVY